ncbi:ABC transporter substrate-binding protein [Leeia sp. TBRC 13508]|uniref:ABC transporter substrate-binding protein n=1 Tax=Leeia speluncae TaxID=2884804 RepID=A0ABS8DA65_9NEIS|nr:ABC transporter substrate-binding protein [Leeia speluncae]MCB6185106.1 ABC transporter substrate-binding protein [Leeia speluncae]
MKKLFLLCLLGYSFGSNADAIKEIRFGVEAAYPPFEFKDAQGKLTGFDIELGNALCAELKAKCTWVESPFDGLIPALQAKKFDAINSAISITEKRKKVVNFTNPLYHSPTYLVAPKGSALTPTAAALKGKVIGVLRGSIQEDFANQRLKTNGVQVQSYEDQNVAFNDLASGRLDGTIVEASTAMDGFIKKPEGKGFSFAGPAVKDPLLGVGIGIAVRKEDVQLTQALNSAFEQVKKKGTFQKLMKKYFDYNIAIN